MTGPQIVAKVKSLNLAKDSYIVFGSGPMAAAGIRESEDIDFLVNPEQFEAFRKLGWQQITKGENDKPLIFDVFEAHPNWDFSSFNPTLKELLTRATYFEGVAFASLEDVKAWKAASGRQKDLDDLKLIAEHEG